MTDILRRLLVAFLLALAELFDCLGLVLENTLAFLMLVIDLLKEKTDAH